MKDALILRKKSIYNRDGTLSVNRWYYSNYKVRRDSGLPLCKNVWHAPKREYLEEYIIHQYEDHLKVNKSQSECNIKEIEAETK